jgi:hypothetical protein
MKQVVWATAMLVAKSTWVDPPELIPMEVESMITEFELRKLIRHESGQSAKLCDYTPIALQRCKFQGAYLQSQWCSTFPSKRFE